MNTFIEPIREKIKSIASNDSVLSKAAAMGREKALSAQKTINDVRNIIGFKKI